MMRWRMSRRGAAAGKRTGALFLLLGTTVLMGICCVKPGGTHPKAVEAARPSSMPTTEAPEAREGLLEGYVLGQPDEQQTLPEVLDEISGLTDISTSEVGCVQDEAGIVFIYDLQKRGITRQIPFADGGDFEGLTRVKSDLYALRSDGTIYQIEDFASSHPTSRATKLRLPTPDNEGLCYDPIEARILIAPKSRLGKSEEEKRTRVLFRFDPDKKRVDAEPVVVFDLDQVYDGRERERETRRGKKRVLPSRFLPSSVSVHPKTGDYFVVSAVAHNLAVFDRQGQLKSQFPLDPKLLPQPEGITFLPDGTLIITSEGAGERARLLRFSYRS